MEQLDNFLDYKLLTLTKHDVTIKLLLFALVVLVVTKFLASTVQRYILKPFFSRNGVDVGRSYAITRILKYLLYLTGLFTALNIVGLEFSVLWTGAAALLVGVGLGLQQTFNDFVSGMILLLEGPIEVGNVVEVDGLIGRVVEIGLRTSKIRTRDDIMIITPNSHFVNESIVNWTHIRSPLRYSVDVGVAYGTDVDRVQDILLDIAKGHDEVLDRPVSRIMFKDFGASSLDFTLYFYSKEPWRIEMVKSDLRFKIYKMFAAEGIEIPFPQQDVWFKSASSPLPENGTDLPPAEHQSD